MTMKHDVSDVDYHNDRTPMLNQSTAKVLLDKSPLHAYHQHPALGGHQFRPTKAMERGTLMHRLVLGKGPEIVAVGEDSWRKNVAREARDAAHARGAVPVLAKDMDPALEAAEIIRRRLTEDYGIPLDGASEVSVYWDETASDGSAVRCRGRLDHVPKPIDDPRDIIDLKFTADASPDVVAGLIFRMGYDVQGAAYTRAIEKEFDAEGEVRFRWVWVEPEPPYAIFVSSLDAEYRAVGERRWMKAVDAWAECLGTGKWPGYGEQTVAAPAWVLERAERQTLEDDDDDGT